MSKKYLLGLVFIFILGMIVNSCFLFRQSDLRDITTNDSVAKSTQTILDSDQKESEFQMNNELYSNLYTYVNNPQLITQSGMFEQEISFVAQMKGSPMKIDSPEETLDGEWYISVYLLRNQKKPLYVNVSLIEKEAWPKDGDVLSISGKPVGYLYAIHENERINVLDIDGTDIKKRTHTIPPITEGTIETMDYKITITDMVVVPDSFDNKALIIYYTFKNKKNSTAISPIRTYFFFTQGKEQLSHTILADQSDKLDPMALKDEALEPDTELLYYAALHLIEEKMPVNITVYDDEYNLLSRQELSLPEAE